LREGESGEKTIWRLSPLSVTMAVSAKPLSRRFGLPEGFHAVRATGLPHHRHHVSPAHADFRHYSSRFDVGGNERLLACATDLREIVSSWPAEQPGEL
jgi:hypothetical protein